MVDAAAIDFWMQVQSILVEVEGMKAENITRQDRGYSLAYGDEAFNEASCRIDAVRQEMIGYYKNKP